MAPMQKRSFWSSAYAVMAETIVIRERAKSALHSVDPQNMALKSPVAAVCISLFLSLALSSTSAKAEESPFVWSATGSPEDLGIRTGLALDLPGRPRFGSESNLRLSTGSQSGTVHPPLRLWGEVDVRKSDVAPASVGVRLDLVSGAARAALRQSRTITADGPAVVSLNRTFEAGRRSNGESAFLASQDLRLAFSDIDTIVTGGILMDNKAPFRAEIGLEKNLRPGIRLNATLSDLAHKPNARLNARFERQW
jgi:hypothetical protein